MRLDEARRTEHAFQGEDRRVEALEVADLQDATAAPGGLDQGARLLRRLGDRLLDQHVQAVLEAVLRHRVVRGRGGGDAHRVDRVEDVAVISDRATADLGRHRVPGLGAQVHHRHQRRLRQVGVFLRVESPQVSHADHCGAYGLHRRR
jgi:hypothetical protein